MTALVTPTEVRSFLSLAATQDEALLILLCDAASAFVLSYLGRTTLAITARTETLNGTGTQLIVPRYAPITTVTSVKINGNVIPPSTGYGVAGWRFDGFTIALRDYRFDRGSGNVEISYASGFAVVPADLKQAVIEVIAEKYQRRLRIGITSKSIGQESISYSQQDLGPSAKLALAPYKVRFIPT